MSFARFEPSYAHAENPVDSNHAKQALDPSEYWMGDGASTLAGGGNSNKKIRLAQADVKLESAPGLMFQPGDMNASDMLDDLGQRWTAAQEAGKPIAKEAMNQYVERAKELVTTSDAEFAQRLPRLEMQYEKISPGLHIFKSELVDLWKKVEPLLGGLQQNDRDKIELFMKPDRLIWDMSEGTIKSLKNAAIKTEVAPYVKSLERKLDDGTLMFFQVQSIRKGILALKGQTTVSRNLAEEIFTAAGLNKDAQRVNQENQTLYSISISNLDEMTSSLKKFFEKHSA